jgi:uncharacterized membrane protein
MSSLESSKNLAGIGAILLMLSFIPAAGVIIGIIGVVLLLMGIKGLANYYQDNEIYKNALTGIIFYVIALISVAVALAGLAFGGIFGGLSAGLVGVGLAVAVFIGAVVIAFIFYVLAAIHLRRSFSALAQKSGEHMFETAGLILFIGAILTIILVGIALILFAWLLLTIAFFSIRTPLQNSAYTPPPVATSQPSQQPNAPVYCSGCGAPVNANSTYCSHCGKQIS